MRLPPGFVDHSNLLQNSRVVLLRNPYGLKQSPRLWYQHIHKFLLLLSFASSEANPNLYTNNGMSLLLYVDDIIICYPDSSTARAKENKEALAFQYRNKDMGRIRQFLDIEIFPTEDAIVLSQPRYISNMLDRFEVDDITAHPPSMPT